ncbi:calcium binding egf domain-containing protein [Cardiosporidium cionae]|uniref:Calcium binding egf domain-containing protein n=1 Tax=Cardiosporidium cionae TaxID=476202 RepID=A0ABQ7J6T1_9APIC|nr:calcium binding egf domain-containing protein [Cardiosporidium cionae]|eukprot:KAF8819695.1 calcium binding egf domain-containing protein [Cardiosporidium cionae]
MLYLHADNNLEGPALHDLNEILRPSTRESIEKTYFVVIVDRTKGESNGKIGPIVACPSLEYAENNFKKLNDGIPRNFEGAYELLRVLEDGKYKWLLLKDWGEVDMNKPYILETFLAKNMKLFSAQHYALTIWNHGSAWVGIGDDSDNRDYYPMALTTLKQAIEKGLTNVREHKQLPSLKLSLLGFDACLMSAYSVLDALSPYTYYFVASEENEPGYGWNYRMMSAERWKHSTVTDLDAFEYAKQIVNGYDQSTLSYPSTLAVVEIQKFDAFNREFKNLLEQLAECGGREMPVFVKKAITKAHSIEGCRMIGLCGCTDLGHWLSILLEELAINNASPTVQLQAITAQRSYKEMIVYQINRNNAILTGISIYFPDPNMKITCDDPIRGFMWQKEFFNRIETKYASFVNKVEKEQQASVCYNSATDSLTLTTSLLSSPETKDFSILQGKLSQSIDQFWISIVVPINVISSYALRGVPSNASSGWIYINSVAQTSTSDYLLSHVSHLTNSWSGNIWIGKQKHLQVLDKDPRPLPSFLDNSTSAIDNNITVNNNGVHHAVLFAYEQHDNSENRQIVYLRIPFILFPTLKEFHAAKEHISISKSILSHEESFLAVVSLFKNYGIKQAFMSVRIDAKTLKQNQTLFVLNDKVISEWKSYQTSVLLPIVKRYNVKSPLTNSTADTGIFRQSFWETIGRLSENITEAQMGIAEAILQEDIGTDTFLWGDKNNLEEFTVEPVHFADPLSDSIFSGNDTIMGLVAKDTSSSYVAFLASIGSNNHVCTKERIANGICDIACNSDKYQFDGGDCPHQMQSLQLAEEGFSGNGFTCVDINECQENPNICNHDSMCINIKGSYRCICQNKLTIAGSLLCRTACEDIDECAAGLSSCDSSAKCINTNGGYLCSCLEDYDGDGRTCVKGKAAVKIHMQIPLDITEATKIDRTKSFKTFKELFVQSIFESIPGLAAQRIKIIRIFEGSINIRFRINSRNGDERSASEILFLLQNQLSEPNSKIKLGEFSKFAKVAIIANYQFQSAAEVLLENILEFVFAWIPDDAKEHLFEYKRWLIYILLFIAIPSIFVGVCCACICRRCGRRKQVVLKKREPKPKRSTIKNPKPLSENSTPEFPNFYQSMYTTESSSLNSPPHHPPFPKRM